MKNNLLTVWLAVLRAGKVMLSAKLVSGFMGGNALELDTLFVDDNGELDAEI